MESSISGCRIVQERRRLLQVELTTLCESFYYLAFRVSSIVGFECVCIRNVRKRLIEHPEGEDSRAVHWNFWLGVEMVDGPVIKPFGSRTTNPRHTPGLTDKGLYSNAREFVGAITQWLTRA